MYIHVHVHVVYMYIASRIMLYHVNNLIFDFFFAAFAQIEVFIVSLMCSGMFQFST